LSVPIVKQITNPSTATVLTVQSNLVANSITYALPLPTKFTEVLLYSRYLGNSEYSASSTTDLTLVLLAPTTTIFTLNPGSIAYYRIKLRIDGVNFSSISDATTILIEGTIAFNIVEATMDSIEF
jgi:hypothetical protein